MVPYFVQLLKFLSKIERKKKLRKYSDFNKKKKINLVVVHLKTFSLFLFICSVKESTLSLFLSLGAASIFSPLLFCSSMFKFCLILSRISSWVSASFHYQKLISNIIKAKPRFFCYNLSFAGFLTQSLPPSFLQFFLSPSQFESLVSKSIFSGVGRCFDDSKQKFAVLFSNSKESLVFHLFSTIKWKYYYFKWFNLFFFTKTFNLSFSLSKVCNFENMSSFSVNSCFNWESFMKKQIN